MHLKLIRRPFFDSKFKQVYVEVIQQFLYGLSDYSSFNYFYFVDRSTCFRKQ